MPDWRTISSPGLAWAAAARKVQSSTTQGAPGSRSSAKVVTVSVVLATAAGGHTESATIAAIALTMVAMTPRWRAANQARDLIPPLHLTLSVWPAVGCGGRSLHLSGSPMDTGASIACPRRCSRVVDAERSGRTSGVAFCIPAPLLRCPLSAPRASMTLRIFTASTPGRFERLTHACAR